jgi:hypothetical protein
VVSPSIAFRLSPKVAVTVRSRTFPPYLKLRARSEPSPVTQLSTASLLGQPLVRMSLGQKKKKNNFLLNSSRAIRSRFGTAIKTKTLSNDFKGMSITNTTTHSTRVRVAILKVNLLAYFG